MTILSDVTIRELCVPPSRIYDQTLHHELTRAQNEKGWPSHDQAERKIRLDLEEKAHRPLNGKELADFRPMISPFLPELVREVLRAEFPQEIWADGKLVYDEPTRHMRKTISYGTTSYGYDVRLTDDVKIFTNVNAAEIDPKRFNQQGCLVDAQVQVDEDGARFIRIPPNSYMLGSTVETFVIPRDIMVVCLGKSTYARCGAIVNTTPIEPGFEGNVVIEISNSTPLPIRVYLDEGIAQFLFFRGDRPCGTSYADRGGKYQGQTGVTLPKV